MNSNHLLEADAGMETDAQERDEASNGGFGSRTMIAPEGGSDVELASEESPLLLNSSRDGQEDVPSQTWEGASDFIGLPWWQQPSVYWLLPPFLLYAIAFGGIAVPRLTLALKLICRVYLREKAEADPNFTFLPVLLGEDSPQCRIPEVQALATKFMLYITLIGGILSAIVSPKLGALSDRYGRKPILCFIIMGGILSEAVTILAAKYPDTVHYTWLLFGAFLDGMAGSFIAGMAVMHSYATDITPPPGRAVAFGYFHAAMFGGVALGPLMAAFVIKLTGDVAVPFLIALICHCIYLGCIAFVVPESLSKKRQLAAREKYRLEQEVVREDSPWLRRFHGAGLGRERKSPLVMNWLRTLRQGNFLAPLKILYPTGRGTSSALRANLILLSSIDTIIFGIAMSAATVVLYYAEYQLGWEDVEKNVFVSITSTARVSVLITVLPLLNYLVRTRRRSRIRRESGVQVVERNSGSDNLDLSIIRVGLVIEMIGFAGYAVARASPLFVMSGILASVGGIASPTLQSALTKHVSHDRTGQVLGATGLLHGLARVVFPAIFSMVYASTVKTVPQVTFFLITGFFGVAFLFSCFIKPHIYLEEQGSKPVSRQNVSNEERDAERIADEEAAGI